MNYLSHHAVALDRYGEDEAPAFYVGNVLPDLVATSGDGRLRPRLFPAGETDPLLIGVRLHWETDRRFHGLPAFVEAQEEAKRLLRATPFETPLHRVFFIAHAAVEIALDGLLLSAAPALADDFYARFARADLSAIVAQTETLLPPADAPQMRMRSLTRTIERFVASRYLLHYATAEGQAHALRRVCERTGIAPRFASDDDFQLLTAFFAALADALALRVDGLLLRSETTPLVVE